MTTGLVPSPKMQFFDANGNPLVGGKLYSYAAGTSTPLATYTDSTGGTANANPVILDSRGEASVWCSSASYKFELYTSASALVWTADNINGANEPTLAVLAASGGSDLIGYYAPDSAETMTVQDRLQLLDGEAITAGNADSYAKASINCFRDTTAVTGGTAGFVNPCIIAQTDAGASQISYEWTILGILNNYNNSTAENVAGYFQGNKRGTGGTWGLVAEAMDYTNTADPTAGLVGFEVDCFANGTDANSRRIAIDVVIGKATPAGTKPTIYAGIRLLPQSLTYTNGKFEHGILMDCDMDTAIRINNNAGIWGIYISGTMDVGIDLIGTYNDAAIRMVAGSKLAFDTTGTVYLQEVSGALGVDGGWFNFQLGFGVTSSGNTQTTVGAAGGASSLPATPTGYLKFRLDGVQSYVIPYYAKT